MANPLEWLGEQIRYLFYGPVAQSNHHDDLREAQPPALPHTSAAWEAHIEEAANYGANTSSSMKTFSQAWDETERRGIEPRLRAASTGMNERDRKETLLQCYLDNPWVASCVEAIVKRITSGGFAIEPIKHQGKGDQAGNEENLQTLEKFCRLVNEHWDFLQFARSILSNILIYGEAFAEIVYKDGQPWKLYTIDCLTMSYQLDPHGKIIKYFQQLDSNQKPIPIEPEFIIRWWLPHPRANMIALSPIERILDAVKLDKQMVLWNQTFFKKGAKAPFWIKGPPDENDGKRFATWFIEEYTGEKNAHKPMITWGEDVSINEFKAGAITLDFETGRDRTRDEVLAGFSVPPMIVGVIKTVGLGGTGESQAKDFQYNTCEPLRQLFLEKLNYRIVQADKPKGFGITDYIITTHYADYRDDKEVSDVQDKRIRNGSLLIDEIRQEMGKPPYPKGGNVGIFATGREIIPVPRLDDLEDEQRQGAQLDLQSKQQGIKAQQQQMQAGPQGPGGPQGGQGKAAPGGNVAKQLASPKSPKNASESFAAGAKQLYDYQLLLKHLEARRIEEDSQTGMMLAFFLKPDVADQLAIPGGEAATDLHITLAYLGDTQDQPQDMLNTLRPNTSPFKIRSVIASVAAKSRPLQGQVGGIGRFTSQDDGEQHPVYASVDVPGLSEFRAKIVQAIKAAGYYVSDEHGFTPHITLDYVEPSARMPMKTVPALPLILDRVSLCVGDQCSAWRLGDEPEYWDDQAEEDYDPDATEPRLPAISVEHYPGGKDHDQMKHGAWSPLSAHHNPKVHTKGAAKYNHLTIPAKQKLLATLAAGSQAKADAQAKALLAFPSSEALGSAHLSKFGHSSNATYKTTIDGKEYFVKMRKDPKYNALEVGAYTAGKELGIEAHMTPIAEVKVGDKAYLVSPWTEGKTLADVSSSEMVKAAGKLSPAEFTKLAAYEYLMNEGDRHMGNYVLDTQGNLHEIDMGLALRHTGTNFVGSDMGTSMLSSLHAGSKNILVGRLTLDKAALHDVLSHQDTLMSLFKPLAAAENVNGLKSRFDVLRALSESDDLSLHHLGKLGKTWHQYQKAA